MIGADLLWFWLACFMAMRLTLSGTRLWINGALAWDGTVIL